MDATWLSSLPTPPVPDYPSTHTVLGAAAAAVLARFFETDYVSFQMTSGASQARRSGQGLTGLGQRVAELGYTGAPMTSSAAPRTFDRRFFAFTAIAFTLVVLVGFARTYYLKPYFGGPPLPSLLVHAHGLLMTAWVTLFATQVWLISSRQVRVHQRLGYSGVALAALIVIVGFVTAIRAGKYGSPSMPPNMPAVVFMAVPLFDLVLFTLLFGAAVYYRKKPAAHKSLMLLTAINFLPPAIARIPIAALQNLGPLWFFGLPTLLVLICLAIDWRRRGRLNMVFLAGSVLLIASYPVRLTLMGTAAWMQLALWLTGFV